MYKYITQIGERIGKIMVEINLRSYRMYKYVLPCAEYRETQVCPRSFRKEILHKFYGNMTNTSVADTRSETEVIAALGILPQVSK
jgi:hypothetical protein